MGTINTAIQLSNIRSKIDAQQQIISMLELELQKAILGDQETSIADLFFGKSEVVGFETGANLGKANVINSETQQIYTFDDEQLYQNKLNGKTYIVGNFGDSEDQFFIEVQALDPSIVEDGTTYNYKIVPGQSADSEDAFPVNLNEDLFVEQEVTKTGTEEFSTTGINDVYGDSYGYLTKATANGIGDFGSDISETADQTVIRQMLYQARALLGELRVEEQHWNQEVNEEKSRRKDLGEFAKG